METTLCKVVSDHFRNVLAKKEEIVFQAAKDFLKVETLDIFSLAGRCKIEKSNGLEEYFIDGKPFIEFTESNFENISEDWNGYAFKDTMRYRRLF